MHKKVISLAPVATLLLAGPALAAEHAGRNFTYLDVNYSYNTYSDYSEAFGGITDIEGSGYGFEASYGFTDEFHGFFNWNTQDLNFPADIEFTTVGLGLSKHLSPRADFYLRGGYVSVSADFANGAHNNDSGQAWDLGFRGELVPRWEMEVSMKYMNVEEFIDDTSFHWGTRFSVTDMIGLNLGADFSNEQTSYSAGFRVNFGKYGH